MPEEEERVKPGIEIKEKSESRCLKKRKERNRASKKRKNQNPDA